MYHAAIDKLDPNGIINYRLYSGSMSYLGGQYLKDLTNLNRDLKQVNLINYSYCTIFTNNLDYPLSYINLKQAENFK